MTAPRGFILFRTIIVMGLVLVAFVLVAFVLVAFVLVAFVLVALVSVAFSAVATTLVVLVGFADLISAIAVPAIFVLFVRVAPRMLAVASSIVVRFG